MLTGEEIRRLRTTAGLSQRKMAAIMNCTQREISVLETNKRKPNKQKSMAIITALTSYLYTKNQYLDRDLIPDEFKIYAESLEKLFDSTQAKIMMSK